MKHSTFLLRQNPCVAQPFQEYVFSARDQADDFIRNKQDIVCQDILNNNI